MLQGQVNRQSRRCCCAAFSNGPLFSLDPPLAAVSNTVMDIALLVTTVLTLLVDTAILVILIPGALNDWDKRRSRNKE